MHNHITDPYYFRTLSVLQYSQIFINGKPIKQTIDCKKKYLLILFVIIYTILAFSILFNITIIR